MNLKNINFSFHNYFSDHQGIIEDVYLLGAPVSGDPKDWEKFKTVVAGHITNAYSRLVVYG